jgi:endonuclease/exonuclease/phosphatase family metal-dependent hydrolase
MKLKFASWNVRNVGDESKMIKLAKLIETEDPDVLALQEVNPKFHRKLARSGRFGWAACSLDLRPPFVEQSLDRQRGCSLLGRLPYTLSSVRLLDTVPYLEQTLTAEVSSAPGALTVCSFHIPPGVNHPREKILHLYCIAYWLRRFSSRTVFGIDANEPKTDRRRIEKNAYAKSGARELLSGASATKTERVSVAKKLSWHRLEDTFRRYLHQNPERAAEIRKKEIEEGFREAGSDTTLAVSYNRARGDKKGACRIDFVYATPDIQVKDVRYLYKESRAAGSDHAMVVAELEVQNSPSK